MSEKVVLVAFNGEPMCFVHVLLNALDMHEKGFDVKVVIEGSATKLVNELNQNENPFNSMYQKVIELGLIDCVCKACAVKMNSLDGSKEQGLSSCNEMNGHPSLAKYMEQGYQIITF